jgi:predicted GH43/DUF377 family glycosyl hydrolase
MPKLLPGTATVTAAFLLLLVSCKSKPQETKIEFASQMVAFKPIENNPVFTGTDTLTWDQHIRERGFILYEEEKYKMWYTGYAGGDSDPKSLGYAESTDGIHWQRHMGNPIYQERWTEDVFVMHVDSMYYMFAEGKNDIAHLLTSADGFQWTDQGDLIILDTRGDTLSGPYGTPSVIIENGTWYLFYERNDEAVWIATTSDMRTWINLQDAPVLEKGPGLYDAGAVATNQVIRFGDQYYMFYHGSSDPDWSKPGATSLWTTSVAASKDLIHWVKYPGNPIVEGDHSSGIVVMQNGAYKLFTMHDIVWMFNPE